MLEDEAFFEEVIDRLSVAVDVIPQKIINLMGEELKDLPEDYGPLVACLVVRKLFSSVERIAKEQMSPLQYALLNAFTKQLGIRILVDAKHL